MAQGRREDAERGGDSPGLSAAPVTLAEKLDYLFRQVRGRGRGEMSYREVAAGIEDAGGPTISPTYLMYLRKGQRTNPSLQHLEAIAGYFGVPTSYFLDQEATAKVTQELELLALLRDAGVRSVAMRLADLSPEDLAAVAGIVEELRHGETEPMDPNPSSDTDNPEAY